MDDLERRIAQLELNQRRIAILLNSAPEGHKAWDKACLRHDLTFEQEVASRKAIEGFLHSESTDIDDLVAQVCDIVGHPAVARDVIAAYKQRGTAASRWEQLGFNG